MSTIRARNINSVSPEEGVHVINSHPLNTILGAEYTGKWGPRNYYERDVHAAWYDGQVYLAKTSHVAGEEFEYEHWENITANIQDMDRHMNDMENPHGTTKDHLGLGDVDNVSAADLRDRSTHTGVQPIETVENLRIELDQKIDADSEAVASRNFAVAMAIVFGR